MRYTVIAPIMGDLDEDDRGTIILGPASKKACDHAIEEAKRMREEGGRPLILLTATVPDRGEYSHCTERMGKIAERYIHSVDPTLPTRYHEAKWFITIGEIAAVAEFLKAHDVGQLSLPVKWFHAIRVWVIMWVVFTAKKVQCPKRVPMHSAKTDLGDLIHEFVAVFVNAFDLACWCIAGCIPRIDGKWRLLWPALKPKLGKAFAPKE